MSIELLTIISVVLISITFAMYQYKRQQEKKGFIFTAATGGILGILFIAFQISTIISVIITISKLIFKLQ